MITPGGMHTLDVFSAVAATGILKVFDSATPGMGQMNYCVLEVGTGGTLTVEGSLLGNEWVPLMLTNLVDNSAIAEIVAAGLYRVQISGIRIVQVNVSVAGGFDLAVSMSA